MTVIRHAGHEDNPELYISLPPSVHTVVSTRLLVLKYSCHVALIWMLFHRAPTDNVASMTVKKWLNIDQEMQPYRWIYIVADKHWLPESRFWNILGILRIIIQVIRELRYFPIQCNVHINAYHLREQCCTNAWYLCHFMFQVSLLEPLER